MKMKNCYLLYPYANILVVLLYLLHFIPMMTQFLVFEKYCFINDTGCANAECAILSALLNLYQDTT
jgi:hypothetical protein